MKRYKVGFIGLGKLGLPVAACIALAGHDVMGYDINPCRMTKEPQQYQEAGPDGTGDFNDYLAKADNLSFGSMEEVAKHSDIIFVAVQTPHESRYEGVTALPDDRVDFSYEYLKQSISDLAQVVKPGTIISVISTCLPGTMRREILPLLPGDTYFCYNPFFIAMGTVMRDFIHPEFILIGSDNKGKAQELADFYQTISRANSRIMSIESAELTKVAYNTYISFKIGYVNTLMEICDKLPCADIDEVTGALKQAKKRLISTSYLDGGMGDGGACHPRDNIAMSWLARKLHLGFDLFESVMMSRQRQAQYIARMMMTASMMENLPLVIYGYAFKPDVKITTGSHALLVSSFVDSVKLYDPVIDDSEYEPNHPAVYLVGCKHKGIEKKQWPVGSVVIDPFRIVPNQFGVDVRRLGEGRNEA